MAASQSASRAELANPPETAPIAVEIKEDMNQSPLLIAREEQSSRERVLFDLNPQLSRFDLPRWEVFEWRSRDGQSWRGGLLLPKTRQKDQRVPLVIQTHGFSTIRFLVDGPFSTAFGRSAARGQRFRCFANARRSNHPRERRSCGRLA